jgi:hypothetical protein
MVDNLYKHLNYYLRTGRISPKLKELKKYKFSTTNEFKLFLINMTNNLIHHIHQQNNNKIKYVYRGELRSKFDFKKGDVIIYPQFVSTSQQIGHALGFANIENLKKTHIFYCIKLSNNTKILKLDASAIFQIPNCGKIEMFEHEYILPPLTHFRITSIKKISEIDMKIVNLEVIYQQFYLLKNFDDKFRSDYKISKYYKTYENNNNVKQFIVKLYRSIQNSKKNNIIHNTINDRTRNIFGLVGPWGNCTTNIFDLDLEKILKTTKKHDLNKLNKKYKTNIFGNNFNSFQKNIRNIIKIKKFKPKNIGTIKAYASDFYTPLKDNTLIVCTFNYDSLMRQSVYDNFYPNVKMNDILIYDKYIFKLTIVSEHVNIVRPKHCNKINSTFYIVPPYKYKINNKKNSKNKWGLPIIIYDITIF